MTTLRKFLKVAQYALYTYAVAVAVYVLALWIREPELSYMGLLLRYWYWFLTVVVAAILGGAAYLLEDMV